MPRRTRTGRTGRAVLAAPVVLAVGLSPVAPGTAVAAPGGSAAASPSATPTGLPVVSSGARPGPDVLYAPAPAAPQLENRDRRFTAAMLRVAGTEAYVAGEFLSTDHLYDDYGPDRDLQRGGERAGDVDYPAGARYAGNAADIVEVRVAPGKDAVAYRITLNALVEADTTVVALAFDTDRNALTGRSTLPRDPGAPFPGTDEVVTAWGTGAEHSRLTALGRPVTTPVQVSTDLEANQMTITVPRTVSDPRGRWRTTVVAGVHDPAAGGWYRPPLAQNGIYNVAFRYDEPIVGDSTPPDTAQSAALADDAPTRYARDIDFAALDAGTTRTSVAPGPVQVRMFPSRLRTGEGRDLSAFPQYRGQLQPYTAYVPSAAARGPVGLTLSLHSLGEQHWQYNGGRTFEQLGEQRGNAVLSPMGRGPDGWYQREAEVDVFEAWNDLARVVALDPDRTYSSGYSMGGYGTYRLGGLYPDLFASAFTVVGPPGDGIWLPPAAPTGGAQTLSNLWLENVRHVPYLNMAAAADELVPVVGPRAQNLGAPEVGVQGFEQLGYRFRYLLFPAAEHLTLALLGYDFPAARDHLGQSRVDRDPAHVTFSYLPASDAADLGIVHDHAYWVSQVRAAETSSVTSEAHVDARSRAFGVGEPASEATSGSGVMQLPYVENGRRWLPAPSAPVENVLELDVRNLRSAVLDTARARLDTRRALVVEAAADRNGSVVLSGPFPKSTTATVDGAPLRVTRAQDGSVRLPLRAGAHTYRLAPSGS